jgi:two-component response regulator
MSEIITRRSIKNGKILVTLTKKYFLVLNFKFDIISTMIEILLIEDDLDLAELLKYALAKSEISVTIATNPLDGLKILNEKILLIHWYLILVCQIWTVLKCASTQDKAIRHYLSSYHQLAARR